MQLSLPVLPFDPTAATAGAKAAVASRLTDSSAAGSNSEFGDLLPADSGPAPQSRATDRNLLGLGVSEKPVQADDDSGADASETDAGEENGEPKSDPSLDWFVANGFTQRFVQNPNPPASTAADLEGLSQPEASEVTEAMGGASPGGKAVGLTQPMPANAQGNGRAIAVANRAERKPFVEPGADQPPAEPASVELPAAGVYPASESESTRGEVTPPAPGFAIESETPELEEVTTLEEPVASVPAEEPSEENATALSAPNDSDDGLIADAAAADETVADALVANPAVASDEPFSTNTSSVAEPSLRSVVPSAEPSPAELEVEGVASAMASEQTPGATDAPVSTDETRLSVRVRRGSGPGATDNPVLTDATASDGSAVQGNGVPSGKAFPLADSDKLATAPGLGRAAEKFAAGFERRRGISTTRGIDAEIKTLSVDKESVAPASLGLGINAAKTQLSMAASATNFDLPSSLTPSMTTEAVSATSALEHQTTKEEAPRDAFVSAARRAVDSAIAMAEHFSGGEHRGVSLQFSVSGVELAVRVQLRGDAVHTTFRTDSPELRAALAHEWQVVNAQSSDRPVRLADPVFASSSNGSATQSDTNSHQHRESAARGEFSAEQFAGFRSASRAAQPAATAPAPVTVRHESISTSGRLRTFA